MRQKEERKEAQEREYEKQQVVIEKAQRFIRKTRPVQNQLWLNREKRCLHE